MIGRVGILLALETDAHVLGVFEAVLADDVGISTDTLEVTTVNLYTRLVGEHLHEDTGLRRVEAGTYLCVVTLTILICVQAEIVVIACSVLNLIKVRLDAVANGMRRAEIHRGALYRLYFTRGDVELVTRGEVVGIHIEHLIVTGLGEVSTEIVVVVVGLIDDGRTICLSLPCHVEDVVCRYLVSRDSHHLAGESILSVSSHNRQLQDGVANLLSVVHLMHPTRVATTMQAVRTIVFLQLIRCLTKGELAFLDAVGITADTGSVVRRTVEGVGILGDVVKAEDDIRGLAILVGNDQ